MTHSADCAIHLLLTVTIGRQHRAGARQAPSLLSRNHNAGLKWHDVIIFSLSVYDVVVDTHRKITDVVTSIISGVIVDVRPGGVL